MKQRRLQQPRHLPPVQFDPDRIRPEHRETREEYEAHLDHLRALHQEFLDKKRQELREKREKEKVPLLERLGVEKQAVTEGIKKPIYIDFHRKTPGDRLAIIKPRVQATLKRLQALKDAKEYNDLPLAGNCKDWDLDRVLGQAEKLAKVVDEGYNLEKNEFDATNFFTKKIGEISFRSLHSRYLTIVTEVIKVYKGNYLDWVDTLT